MRKSRDEILMKLKAQKLQLALRKIQDEREDAAKKESNDLAVNSSPQRKLSQNMREAGGKHSERFLLPPINSRGASNPGLLGSTSAPVSLSVSPVLTRRAGMQPITEGGRKSEGSLSVGKIRSLSSVTFDAYCYNSNSENRQNEGDRQGKAGAEGIRKISRPKLLPSYVPQTRRRRATTFMDNSSNFADDGNAIDTLESKFRQLKDCRYLRRNTECQFKDPS